ncbi:MAG: hypothetical protein Q7S16_05040 [bacterium]|nr:hypothetical protein [bacterium]
MKNPFVFILPLSIFLLIGAGCQRQQEVVSSYDDLASLAVDTDFRITNIGDSATIGDPVTSVLPIYAYGCDVYGASKDEPQRYSKIDFFISEDKKDSPVTLLGTTAAGSGGSGECDLLSNESSITSKLKPGSYHVWAVRYIDSKPDKRTADIKISLVDSIGQIYQNKQYGFAFQYPNEKIDVQEIGDTLGNGLFSVPFLQRENATAGDRNINGGLRVFLNIPNVAFGRYTLEDLLAGRDIKWETLAGSSKEYQWQCGDSANVGGEKIRQCYFQKEKNVYEFDYNYEFSDVLSREKFDAIVKSFQL